MTLPMLERVTLEALITPADAPGFRLDHDRLNQGRLSDTEPSWTPITATVRDLSITRGGRPDKVTARPEVGTAQIVFVDLPDTPLRPSTPIRITAAGERLFTGHVLDLKQTEHRRRPDSTPRRLLTVVAVDLVDHLANTMRYGAYESAPEGFPWLTFETAAERFSRYLRPLGLPYEGPTLAPDAGSVGDWQTTWGKTLDTGDPVPGDATSTRPALARFEFTAGQTYNASSTHGPSAPAGVMPQRFPVSSVPVPEGTHVLSMLLKVTPDAAGNVPQLRLVGGALSGIGPYSIDELLPELRPGRWEYVSLPFSWPEGIRSNRYLAVTNAQTYTAPGGGGAVIEGMGAFITRGTEGAGLPVQNIVYESTLTNHLDLTANTTGGAWWIDAHNVIHYRPEPFGRDLDPAVTFTDGTGPGDASYVGLDLSFDTAGMVNDLSFENHGRAWDDEERAWRADDRTIDAGDDPTSIATYGRRAESLDTAVPITAPRADVLADVAPELLAREYLTPDRVTPSMAPRALRIWHNPAAPALPTLDVFDPVAVTYQGTTWPLTVAGIEHSIDSDHWHTDLTLIERN